MGQQGYGCDLEVSQYQRLSQDVLLKNTMKLALCNWFSHHFRESFLEEMGTVVCLYLLQPTHISLTPEKCVPTLSPAHSLPGPQLLHLSSTETMSSPNWVIGDWISNL